MRDGPSSTHTTCSVAARVRALASCDLDGHVAFIRKALARGHSCKEIGAALGVPEASINRYANKHRMVRNNVRCAGHSHYLPPCHGGADGPITSRAFKAGRR